MPLIEFESDLLWWLGTGNYNIALFVSGYGLSMKQGGGNWGNISKTTLKNLEKRGLLSSTPNGSERNYRLTYEGRREAAKIYFDIQKESAIA